MDDSTAAEEDYTHNGDDLFICSFIRSFVWYPLHYRDRFQFLAISLCADSAVSVPQMLNEEWNCTAVEHTEQKYLPNDISHAWSQWFEIEGRRKNYVKTLTHSLTRTHAYVKTFQINRNSCENVFLIEMKGRSEKITHTHAPTYIAHIDAFMWKRISTFFWRNQVKIDGFFDLFSSQVRYFVVMNCAPARVSITTMCELTFFSQFMLFISTFIEKKTIIDLKLIFVAICDWHSFVFVKR